MYSMDEKAVKASQRALISNRSSTWGLAISIGYVALTVISIILEVIFLKVGIDSSDIITQLILQILLSAFFMTVPVIFGVAAERLSLKSLLSFRKVKLSLLFPLVMIGLCGGMISSTMTNSFVNVLQVFGLYPEQPDFPIPESIGGTLLFFFTVSVMPAVFEEFAYRGVILGALRRYGNSFAIIASSALFGLMHGNLVQIPFAFVLGCVMGYINVVTDSFWPSVIIHFLNNFVSCVQQLALERYGEITASTVIVVTISIGLILGIIGLFALCKKYKHPFAPIHEAIPIETKTAVSAFLICPGTIAAYFVFGGLAVVQMLSY